MYSIKPITTLLIANRGEIARRIIRTAKAMGLNTVAVYSEADRNALYVHDADEAIFIGASAPERSYLDGDRILEAAARSGADAIHPGYGFLSENHEFASRCVEAGLIFVGPSPAIIEQMGSKQRARLLMAAHGVPVIPGYDGDNQDPDFLADKARELGFPLLIKASAGGGGKGMRVLESPDQGVLDAIAAAKREALGAFGDGTLLLERYISRPRHIEFQIVGDRYEHLIHLFERECSIQRRHQKLIEETPSPALDGDLRARMAEAALRVGRAISYDSVGTVEFILAPDGRFYFLEVNTRLQVEHPVTELVFDIDLVRLQIEIAEGRPLRLRQDDCHPRGHAVEARLYAEAPSRGFLPTSGRLVDWWAETGMGIRIDAAVESQAEIGIDYDPLLAKVIAWGQDRVEATRKLIRALTRLSACGIETNRTFLIDVLSHPAWKAGALHTHFIDEHLLPIETREDPDEKARDAVAAALWLHLGRRPVNPLIPHIPPGYRNNRYREAMCSLQIGDERFDVVHRHLDRYTHRLACGSALFEARVIEYAPPIMRIELNGHLLRFRIIRVDDTLFFGGGPRDRRITMCPRFPKARDTRRHGEANAPMPGRIHAIAVKEGDEVHEGQTLVILEAMKMEHAMVAPEAGRVAAILVKKGEVVEAGAPLIRLEPSAPEEESKGSNPEHGSSSLD